MILVTSAKVTFLAHNGRKEFTIRKVIRVLIETSCKTLTDTATIEIPRNIKFFENEKEQNRKYVTKVFRIGDPVIIELGYGVDSKLVKEFTGYISAPISAGEIIVIRCEDEMYNIKRIAVNYSSPSVTVKALMQAILPGYEVDCEDINLGGVRLAQTNVAAVLEKLTDDPWNLRCYMRGKKLFIEGTERSDVGTASFDLDRDAIDNNLDYKKSDDVIIKVKATSVTVNGQKVDFTIGEDGGKEVNLTYYNIEVAAEIKKKAQADYARLKQGGFDGSISTLVLPSVSQGMKIGLTSNIYPDRNGTYYAESVTKEFEPANYRQSITLGRAI